MTLVKHTARQIHRHRKDLRQRIRDSDDESFLLVGDLAYIANRYGNCSITEESSRLFIDGRAYRLEQTEEGVRLHVTPVS